MRWGRCGAEDATCLQPHVGGSLGSLLLTAECPTQTRRILNPFLLGDLPSLTTS